MSDSREARAEQRRQDGPNDEAVEEEIEIEFEEVVGEGAERLHRTLRATLVTGFLGGVEVGIGVLVYLGILYQTGDQLLAGLGFSIGLIALLLAHSELFTENFLLPIAALVAREGTWLDLAKLWGGTLLSNLLGGWLIMAIIVLAFPDWHPVLAETAEHFIEAPLTLEFAALAILGGAVITLMTRMQTGTESVPAKIAAAVAGGFVLAGFQLFHSILDSLFAFGAIISGAPITYLDWLLWFLPVLLLNLAGGVLLVTLLRIVRTGELFELRRRKNAGRA
ncbi:MAG: formate/nitrite transporter family protein [Actinobacteria bacterium]|jgi:formate/nitrite transporter FocA (FNT family)|uniref:formate/nitrite transporter family protein n=1 Tax=Microbacterium TaxID=33882 RepID=UPI000EDEEAB0|nr:MULTISPECIES: formate/nitrite transporter family protein [Microbacterium]MEC8762960.1 formate/nitrite transporter family protein [Actinomycetota bacterium]HAM12919.1 formate transporter [Microbacterium sp.]MCC4268909.1 formate/nitrite transporter family protein [Microbacterium schleiferi]RUA26089.1 MAG: formate/nitrite transporter family protein [Actinomycetota bacterium]HCM51280.1 formate transporter [Microbacterium sp.]|tara:strand:- start:3544 stop:4380 length:837 start_codon:yes stop_codon:yes gene_type:complete